MLLMGVKEENRWLCSQWKLTYGTGWTEITKAVKTAYPYYENVEVLVDNIKVVAPDVDGVVNILIVEFRIALLDGLQCLALGDGAEVLPIGHNKAHRIVAGNADKLLGHLGVGEELLVLAVGADKAADEGEQEHGHQNGQADDSQTVAEEPLGDERAWGQNLDAAVIVQGVLLLLRVLVLRIFAHGCAVSFL